LGKTRHSKEVNKLIEKLKTELQIRGFSEKTIKAYVFHNQRFLNFIKKEPDEISGDDVKSYMAYLMAEKKQKPSSVNLVLSALKFMYQEIMKKRIFDDIKSPKNEKKLPTVLTRNEIERMIKAVKNPKHKLLIEFMYSSGLRVSECVSIKIEDLNLQEKMGLIKSGKGKKDRNIILSRKLVSDLTDYLANRSDDNPYVFPVKDKHISVRQAQKIVHDAAKKAGIQKRVFCHALRSSFATHLLENGTDIRIIQELLGHSNIQTTEHYTKVSRAQLKKVISPFDT